MKTMRRPNQTVEFTLRIAIVCSMVLTMWGCHSVGRQFPLPGNRPIEYTSPAEVRSLIERITQKPREVPKSIAYSYSNGIGHVDSYIPSNWFMEQDFDPNEHHYRYTYHDGRLVTCTYLGDPEQITDSIWYNSAGAPVLNCRFSQGRCSGYMYAVFDRTGRIRKIYRFSPSYDLNRYKEFIYPGDSTLVRDFDRNSTPGLETLYENGEVFLIRNANKKKVNNGTRTQLICRPAKFALKPIYPAY
jgi:hypothetical protein